MSISSNKRKKAKRRALDATNPERARIRRKIRSGELPKYKIERVTAGAGKRKKTNWALQSVFNLLTKIEAPTPAIDTSEDAA